MLAIKVKVYYLIEVSTDFNLSKIEVGGAYTIGSFV
jgi:hypothetical protein